MNGDTDLYLSLYRMTSISVHFLLDIVYYMSILVHIGCEREYMVCVYT